MPIIKHFIGVSRYSKQIYIKTESNMNTEYKNSICSSTWVSNWALTNKKIPAEQVVQM